jgi:hypothetical protein
LKRRTVWALTTLAALAGCRGIIGVEDLGLDAGADAATASKDASTNDAGTMTDGSVLTDGTLLDVFVPMEGGGPPPIDAAVLGTCMGMTGSACQGCCRMNYGMEQQKLDTYAVTDHCICGGAQCTTECATNVCAGEAGMPPPTCGQCIDGEYNTGAMQKSGPCFKALNDCNMDLTCQLAAQCHLACPQ